MKSPHRIAFLLGAVFVFCCASASPQGAGQNTKLSRPRLTLQPCRLPNVEGEARCGEHEVFEDREARAGRKIRLNIVVLPATDPTPAPDPVFVVVGGPGQAATSVVAGARFGRWATVRKKRDLVFVDQRGTGKSNPLHCDVGDDPSGDLQSFFGEIYRPDKVRECRKELEKVANLTLYTTPIAMDDLDEVRDALGYDKINLDAGSYGTIAAQVYMRRHPARVRTALLMGVAHPGMKQPLPFAKGAQHALDRLFDDCAADEVCRAAFPNLRGEFAAVLARFDKGPVVAELIHPATKQRQRVEITRGNFVEHLRLILYSTSRTRFVPLMIHRAFEHDYLPFEALALRYGNNAGRNIANGMYFSVTCSESVPFITKGDILKESRGTFVGEFRVRRHIEACREWPRGHIPRSFTRPVKFGAPVLMISGNLDPSTPYWLGEEAVRHMPNGRRVTIKYYGHQVDTECVADIAARFIESGTAAGLDTTCTEKIRRPPFATALPKEASLQ